MKTTPMTSTDITEPWLFTPGPLTTSKTVKQAMLHDYGSRDSKFIEINASIRNRLIGILNGTDDFLCVPLQGSGTFIVEAMIATLVPRKAKLLILVNGAYGKRICKICDYHQRDYRVNETAEDVPVDLQQLDKTLTDDADITHVVVVHCETTSVILNPVDDVARIVEKHSRKLLIDAMSAFGAIELDATKSRFSCVVASSNKCLEGVPGLGFCLVRQSDLEQCQGQCDSLSLDLYDQWIAMEKNGQWRFTPPTHVILAFSQALDEFDAEGGVKGRGARYRENCDILMKGMIKMGFKPLLDGKLQAPIILTFHLPGDPNFDFQVFYNYLRERGYVIYPGKLTVADSFRVGCIGRLNAEHMQALLNAISEFLQSNNIKQVAA